MDNTYVKDKIDCHLKSPATTYDITDMAVFSETLGLWKFYSTKEVEESEENMYYDYVTTHTYGEYVFGKSNISKYSEGLFLEECSCELSNKRANDIFPCTIIKDHTMKGCSHDGALHNIQLPSGSLALNIKGIIESCDGRPALSTSESCDERNESIKDSLLHDHTMLVKSESSKHNVTPYQIAIKPKHLVIVRSGSSSDTSSITYQVSNDSVKNDNHELFSSQIESNLIKANVVWFPKFLPPTRKTVALAMQSNNIAMMRYIELFYSNASATEMVEIGTNTLKINSNRVANVDEFITTYSEHSLAHVQQIVLHKKRVTKTAFAANISCTVVTLMLPPTRKEVRKWLKQKQALAENGVRAKVIKSIISNSIDQLQSSPSSFKVSCGSQESNNSLRKSFLHSQFLNNLVAANKASNYWNITGDSLNKLDLSIQNLKNARAVNENQHLTLFVMELHVETRGDFKPDPQHDPIKAIFYSIVNDSPLKCNFSGIIVWNFSNDRIIENNFEVVYVDSEKNLIRRFIETIKTSDPDILAGYEIEMQSWGYLIERSYVLEINALSKISRVPTETRHNKPQSHLSLIGRVTLNIWRLMRHEIALQSYTFENVVFHLLHQRIPFYTFQQLSFWWEHYSNRFRHRTINFYFKKIRGILQILEHLDFISRTSELAKLFGIQFYEVLSRGSQFRVESLLLRLVKPLNYVAVSPNVEQRAHMRAPESLPLILEPQSKLYIDPVIVLDFQSLYPSIIIAYNYCFSTCLGRVEHLGSSDDPFQFGATQLKISKTRVKKLVYKDMLHFSPCRVAFVKPEIRMGMLPKMLQEILDTRLMVKDSMKKNKGDQVLQRVLYSRQLGLKLIANVTYGYTAANFSGRMPCSEVGDSVVSKGRETLDRAIKLVESTSKWGAKVVYGDTDSLFVLVPGRSKQDAFKIGEEIADIVTADNPRPVKLKLEKIFQPCILQTKKRYVGYMYESPEQTEPEFLAKGIETIRRDGCPAVSKVKKTFSCLN